MEETRKYQHKVQYYETDQMSIVHHSNYIRWFEEARVDYMEQWGMGYDQMEQEGIISPVLEVNSKYKKMTRFGDIVCIEAFVKKYNGIKLVIGYRVTDSVTDELCCVGETKHCFLKKDGKLISLEKEHPAFHQMFASQIISSF